MKKIAVLTLYGNSNFGNKLQEYAVKETCKKIGFETYTIKNYSESTPNLNIIITVLINKIKNIKKMVKRKEKFKNVNFKKFNKEYLLEDKKNYYSNQKNKCLSKKYDYFIIGSDQVWNPSFGLKGSFKFLECAGNKKKIAFSASFGVDQIINEQEYKVGLNKIKYISVRENEGKKIIEKLTGRKDIKVLVDPTMLLSKHEWKKIEKKPTNLKNQKYILNYFLGKMPEDIKKNIYKLAERKGWSVINVLDPNDPYYDSGPSEFVYLEEHAELICTDSFHSCVFAILMETPFIVFDRVDSNENMNSRINTLLSKFNLKERKYNGVFDEKFIGCDFSDTYEILKAERIKAENFLIEALEINE